MLEPGVAGAPPVDSCQRPGCEEPLPPQGAEGFHPMRKYCDDHQPKKKAKADKAPKSVTINVKTSAPKTKPKAGPPAEVVAGATAMLQFVALGFGMVGDTVCASAVQQSAPGIAAQLGELAVYHPGIAKVFAPTNLSGETGAWIGLAIAVAPVVVAILVHHELLPPSLAEKIAGLAGAVMTMTPGPSSEESVADEAPQSVTDAA